MLLDIARIASSLCARHAAKSFTTKALDSGMFWTSRFFMIKAL